MLFAGMNNGGMGIYVPGAASAAAGQYIATQADPQQVAAARAADSTRSVEERIEAAGVARMLSLQSQQHAQVVAAMEADRKAKVVRYAAMGLAVVGGYYLLRRLLG